MNIPNQKLMPFLSFSGNAEDAMHYYAGVFGAKVESITHTQPGQAGDVGKVMNGVLDFGGMKLMFLDMPAAYPAPAFSWATSLFLSFPDEASFDAAFAGISANGTVMMGPEPVNNIRKCAWVTDKFGLTWQLVWM